MRMGLQMGLAAPAPAPEGGGAPAWTTEADSSDSAILAGHTAYYCTYDGGVYAYWGLTGGVWTLLWVDRAGALLRGDTAGATDVTLCTAGPAPFDAAFGTAAVYDTSVAVPNAFTHTADCLIVLHSITVPSAGAITMGFRTTSGGTVGWAVQSLAPSAFRLIQLPASLRATTNGVTTGSRVLVRAVGNNYRAWAGTTEIWGGGYTDAGSSNVTATAADFTNLGTGGAVAALEVYDRVASGAVLTALQQIP